MRKYRPLAMFVFVGITAVLASPQQPVLSDIQPSVPGDMDAALKASHELLDAGRFRDAEIELGVYLRKNDLSAEGHEMLAYALLRENKPKESLSEYTRAASLHTPSSRMLENVGQDYVLLDDNNDADKWTLRAVRMDPTNADAWYSLGRIRYTEQRFGDALSCFQKVLELSPKSVKAENNLGLAYEAQTQTDAAVTASRQAIAWQDAGPAKDISEQPLLNLATVLVHRDMLSEALPLLTKAAKIAPQDVNIHEQLGHLYLQQSNFAAAQQEFQRACELDPGESRFHFLLGQVYRHLGRRELADAQFAIAGQLARESATPKSR